MAHLNIALFIFVFAFILLAASPSTQFPLGGPAPQLHYAVLRCTVLLLAISMAVVMVMCLHGRSGCLPPSA